MMKASKEINLWLLLLGFQTPVEEMLIFVEIPGRTSSKLAIVLQYLSL